MKRIWIIVLLILLGIISFVVFTNRSVDFYFQDKTIRNSLFIINANPISEERRMIHSIDAKVFSWSTQEGDTITVLDKTNLDDRMVWYRLLSSYGDGRNMYIRATGRDVWYFDTYGKYGLWSCYNKNSRCESVLDMIIHTRVPHRVQDIVVEEKWEQTVLLGESWDWIEQVKTWP